LKQFISIFFLLLLWFTGHTQEYNFRNYSVADGLPQSQVYAMCEDNRGYIWLGTRGGGVSRFDGKVFVTFTEEEGLFSNYVRCIYQDTKGNLWFGTDEGVSQYNGHSFTNYSEVNGLSVKMANSICEDQQGRMCIGTENNGIVFIDGKQTLALTKKEGLADSKVHCIYPDKQHRLWIGTENGLTCIYQGKITNYTAKQGLPFSIVTGIVQDAGGWLWFTTYGGGVCSYDGKIFTRYTVKDGLCNNTVLCLANGPDETIWFGTAIGASCYSPKEGTFKTFTDKEGLCGNVIMNIIKDATGNVWLGSSGGGVSHYGGERFIHFTEKSKKTGNWVYAVLQDTENTMWFASSIGGVTKYDGTIYTGYGSKQGFTDAKVKCIYEDEDHLLWFGTVGEGVYYFDGKVFKHLTRKEGLSSNFVNTIISDKNGKIWMGTSGGGLCFYDKNTKTISRHKSNTPETRVYSLCMNDSILCIATQNSGMGWLNTKTPESGIQRYNTPEALNKVTVRSVINANGKIIVGTAGKGILRIDGKTTNLLTKSDGLSSNNIYSLLMDIDGVIWVGSEKGVDKIELDSTIFKIKHIKHYGKEDGFIGPEASQNAACMGSEGNLWFGTIAGAVKYNPKYDEPNTIAPFTHITGLRLFFDKIEDTKYGDSLTNWFPLPQKLILPYDKNNLSFDFIGISLSNPEGVRYKWMLEGSDKQWSPETTLQTATYSNLDPGHYTFKVVACNEDGIWNTKEESLEFTILAPFWKTWWFKVLLVLFTGCAVTALFLWRINRIKKANEEERNKLALQKNIAELEQKALRLQMNPHFIFNALNSIQGFITKNETADAKRHLAKFSKLMRQILENSRSQFISIEEEADILRNYLDLEKLSSGAAFDYTILIDEEIEPSETAIPPMVIQPFVENAVLHGIDKKHDGKIIIEFKKTSNNIVCEVTDNGIGINASRQKKLMDPGKDQSEHTSAGLEITEQRLRLLMDNTVAEPLEYIDLSTIGSQTGTKVIIHLPYINT
jgi:ligand-binding sensor domain-containing protein/two-component sensor histidine kinase